ncbi:hypothetical protein CFC21_034896 [Triticum aestivum]|uniref:Coiled-coil SMC6 And NSE5 INteracting (CANIN) domain-containing protein n=3 Tax=Triticum TaxID=4564 RepID=A0A9R0VHS3_TRITD|nr:uncharacterized protein LOC119267753 isoform X1 [Triticum dicoccoides]XP_044339667.1 uncharacterized protein LOC123060868 isoform X1 [Triticum aestivum]KAF7022054.1 hypothetical protein CFC21_034896 [Triticum aestivum]VAH59515.1 unnamed protein product [Triticum turgidum subsp. durum]
MKIDDPLDFEGDNDPLLTVRRPAKRKKVIELDDLVEDYFNSGKDELKASAAKSKGRPKGDNSDDEDKQVRKEIDFCKFVEECEEKAKAMDPGEDVPQWGQQVFGCQKSPSGLNGTGVENCQLLQSFCGDKQLGFDLEIERGEGFLEGMLINGWLLKLVLLYGSVEDSIASWVLTKLLYSSNKKLQDSASEFWDSLLSLNEDDKPLVNFGYFPSYSILMGAILNYGYLHDAPCTKTCTSEIAVADTSDGGPPQNITAWLRVVSACCKIRKMHSIFSPSEAQDVLVIVISLFLDRRLEGLLLILGDCLNSLISYFNTSEWESSCLMVAESISKRVNMDLNCLRLVDCITGTNDHSKFLRSELALQLLKNSFGLKVSMVANVERILKSVTSINVKEKECNFFVLYMHIVLVDNLLFSSDAFRNKTAIIDAWRNFLRNCSTQIGCTDWRFYASKVRNKASYLLQGAMLKRPAGSGSIPAK